VLRSEAGGDLLDTYQPEREPNVRAIIDMALLMGRTVCITDPAAAAARDAAMLAQRAAGGGPAGGLAYPPILTGRILAGSPGAGDYFPQPWAETGGETVRLDEVMGPGAWLISRRPSETEGGPGVRAIDLTSPDLAPFAADLAAWLDRRGADAVLVRPDRYVFGSGGAADLVAAWAH
jgi:3-(3-hydroxy-phenyl)propionate hydroxylase